MSRSDLEFLWYLPNTVEPGHRGDDVDRRLRAPSTTRSTWPGAVEDHGWDGALLGTGWGRPDTFTVATSLAARTTTFKPLIAIRPGYWRPAHFASAAATLDQLVGGRVRVNIVSGQDNLARVRRRRGRPGPPLRAHQGVHAAGPAAVDRGERDLHGEHFSVERLDRRHPDRAARRPDTRGSTSAAPRRRPSRSRPPRPTCSCSGASRWTAWPSGSSG